MNKLNKSLFGTLCILTLSLAACSSLNSPSRNKSSSSSGEENVSSEVLSSSQESISEVSSSDQELSSEPEQSSAATSEDSSQDPEYSSDNSGEPSSSEISEYSSSENESSEVSHVKGDENWIDYSINSDVKLNLDYESRDFYVDGVGQFSLRTAIDGDTAHFTPFVDSLNKGTMKARFFGIDTPESTGKVQEWGKPASKYTKAILNEAQENGTIVVSSAQDDYGLPNPDSTGERYVSLVWVNLTKKNAPKEELQLLNLMIVQEGLSWVKNVQAMPQFADTFYAAQRQAEVYKLNMHSGLPDKDFNYGDYEDVSLLDVKYEVAASLEDSTHENTFDGAKIRFQGTVCGFVNHILYIQDYVYYDNDDLSKGGEYCGINVFVGMDSLPSKYTKLNTYVQICGLAEFTENYGFQVTDTQGRYPYGTPTSENDAQIIYTPDQNAETEHNLVPREYTLAELNAIAEAKNPFNIDPLNCRVTLVDENGDPLKLTVERTFVSNSSSKEITLYFADASFNCYIPFNYKGDPNNKNYRWIEESDFNGKQFTLSGAYVLHKTTTGKISFQIVPNGQNDLVWINEQ